MTARRNLSLPTHAAFELVAGIATMIAPAIFDFGAGGIVVSFTLGALLIGLSLTPLTARRTASLSWHRDLDSLYLIGAAGAAFGLALAGDRAAAIFFAVLVGLQAGLNVATRYTSTA